MVTCPDCGADWAEAELAAAACQSCGEIILKEDLDILRAYLGISAASPPDVVAPVIESTPIKSPDFEDCPDCSTPLMGEELSAWKTGSACPYCGTISPHEVSTSLLNPPSRFIADSVETEGNMSSQLTASALPSQNITGPSTCLILNSGISVGKVIEVPLGKIGRNDFSQAIRESSYDDALSRISSIHVNIEDGDGLILVTDMGSTNGTYINGEKIVGTQPSELPYGAVLTLSGLSFCLASTKTGSLHITHVESGVRLEYPPEYNDAIHLGRHTESGRRESWYRMAQVLMEAQSDKDHTTLDYISRRHLHVKNDSGTSYVRHQEGKDSWWWPDGLEDGPTDGSYSGIEFRPMLMTRLSYTLRTDRTGNKNSFELTIVYS